MKTIISFLFLVLISLFVSAQKPSDILLRINKEDVTVDEFKRVYLKNIDLVADSPEKDPKAYLDLFIEYKLKVQEAYAQNLHKNPAYVKELKGYRKQLSKKYLTDIAVTEQLIKEAYDRSVLEVNARHILVKVSPGATPADTLSAYNRIIEARSKIIQGANFETIAKQYSEDPSAKSNGGELGWFKAFKMVYPFETAAYETADGEISMPFKSRYGYHIVQPTARRKAQGAVQAAHIMVSLNQKDSSLIPEKRIRDIYALLQQGGDFEKMAKIYSDDKNSALKGGVLNRFEAGQLSSPEFEKEVFALVSSGEYTAPFKTRFGWHIAKLIEKFPIGSYEEEKGALESKVIKDSRAQVISNALLEKLRVQYNVQGVKKIEDFFNSNQGGVISKKKWVYNDTPENEKRQALVIGDTAFTYKEIGLYLERSYSPLEFVNKEAFITKMVHKYVDTKLRAYHEDHLEEKDADFAAILREYKEGLLLFDLMEENIWNKAKNDTTGLRAFYEKHKSEYRVPETAKLTVVTSMKEDVLQNVKQMLLEGEAYSSIKEQINADGKVQALFTKKEIATSSDYFHKQYSPAVGISEVYKNENDFVLYNVTEIAPERSRALEDARGVVLSDYQNEIERTWIQRLTKNADVSINKKVLKKLVKQLK